MGKEAGVGFGRGPAELDTDENRVGEWMQTNSGKRFFPLDPRAEDICMNDIANGLALDCRYGGQGEITKFYSVAEHSYHMAMYAMRQGWTWDAVLATLLHDSPEAYINDLPRAAKHAVGTGYSAVEHHIHEVILRKYDLFHINMQYAARIKELDQRIVPLEKAAVHPKAQAWAYDQFQALDGVKIECLSPEVAKARFLFVYSMVCTYTDRQEEEYEL